MQVSYAMKLMVGPKYGESEKDPNKATFHLSMKQAGFFFQFCDVAEVAIIHKMI
jgi:hypothetical protein